MPRTEEDLLLLTSDEESDNEAIPRGAEHVHDKDVDDGLVDRDKEEEAIVMEKLAAAQSRISPGDYALSGVEPEQSAAIATPTKKKKKKKQQQQQQPMAPELEEVPKDLPDGDEEQRLAAIARDSPELIKLLEEYHTRIGVVRNTLAPLVDSLRKKKLPTNDGMTFLEMKLHLYLNYCMHIVFYMLLKVEGQQVQDHPVVRRLVELRTYMQKLRPLENRLQHSITKLLSMANMDVVKETTVVDDDADINVDIRDIESGRQLPTEHVLDEPEEIEVGPPATNGQKNRKGGPKRPRPEDDEEIDSDEFSDAATPDKMEEDPYAKVKAAKAAKKDGEKTARKAAKRQRLEAKAAVEEDPDARRKVTKRIIDNRGLTPSRRKDIKNPRAHIAKKFKKAVTKRKSQVREAQTPSGLHDVGTTPPSANVSRSVSLRRI